jgi:hypothetical protein
MSLHNAYQKETSAFIWFLFIFIVALDFYFFRTYFFHNIYDYYPVAHDQAYYLQLVYRIHENINKEGWILGLTHSDMLTNGVLFPLQTVLLFSLAGASRFNALLPNFIYFVLLQVTALYTVKSITHRNNLAILFLGLILCVQTPFIVAGGLMDFRMDFIAFCMYGIFTCCAIKSQFFADRKWSIITALVVCLMILLRFITLVYITGVLTSLTCYFFFSLKRSSNIPTSTTRLKIQLSNLAWVGGIIAMVVLPYLWMNKEFFFQYYIMDHVISEKSFRLMEARITGLFSFLIYYPRSIYRNHLTWLSLIAALFVMLSAFYVRFRLRSPSTCNHTMPWKDGFVFIFLCITLPFMILTADPNKSGVVGSIIVIPFLWLVLWLFMYINSTLAETKQSRFIYNVVAITVLLLGLYHQIHELNYRKNQDRLQNLTAITNMYIDIGKVALQKGWPTIFFSVDQIQDYLAAHHIEILYFERSQKMIHASPQKLGASNYPITQAEALNSLKNSNVVIFNLLDYQYKKMTPLPFNQTIGALKPQLVDYAEQHFNRLGDYKIMGYTFRVYVK